MTTPRYSRSGSTDRSTGSKTRTSVLLPTGRKLKSYACMRSLHRQGIGTIVATEFDSVPHFWSRYCTGRARLPSSPENLLAYKDALLELASRPEVATIMPVREYDTYVFARWRDEFDERVSLVTPDLETLRKGHDRLRLAREAEAAGVPVAKTRPLSAVGEVDEPAVIKSRYNVLTSEYVDSYPENTAEEVKRVEFLLPGDEPDRTAIRDEMNHDPIVQSYVPGDEKYLYCALWDHGEPLATYQHKQIRGNSWVGGGGVYRVSAHSQAVEDVAYDLLSHLDWHGFACIEYHRDERTGEWKFLEINPRLWQSLPSTVRAGADFPYYYWLAARGEPERIDPSYEIGVAYHILYGELGHLRSIRRDESPLSDPPSFSGTLWDIATSCITNPRFDYVRLDDPGLVVGCLRELFTNGSERSRQFSSRSSSHRIRQAAAEEGSDRKQRSVAPIEETEETDPTTGAGND